MIIRTPLLIGSAMVLALATPAKAQYAGGAAATETTAPVPTPHKPSSFEALSAGDRKIGRALFLAQHPTESGPAPLSLDQIVNGYQRSETRRPPARASSHRSPTLVTGGDGSVIASSQRGGISHGGAV